MKKINLCLLMLAVLALTVSAQTTEFSYQGTLKDGVNAATGNYDFEFALFDALSAGTQLGTTQQRNAVVVSNGVFSVKLDFGAQFPGANRFLEIRVRLAGQPAFTTLSPRQSVSSSPYSVKSLAADNATNAVNATNASTAVNATNATNAATAANALQLGGVAANQYVLTTDPRMTDARNPLPGSGNYIQNQNAGPQSASNFNISGNGKANIFDAATQFNINGVRTLSSPGAHNIFAGAGAGTANDTGAFNTFVGKDAGTANTSGSENAFVGYGAGAINQIGNGNSFFGAKAGNIFNLGSNNTFVGLSSGMNTLGVTANENTFVGALAGIFNSTSRGNTLIGFGANTTNPGTLLNATAIGNRAFVTQSNSLVLGSINGVNGCSAVTDCGDTNVGIGTTSPSQKLHVVGNGLFTGNLTVNGALNATLPTGSGSYVQNQNAAPQTANFSINGDGTVAGTLTGTTVNSSQYNFNGQPLLTAPSGFLSLFIGFGAGQAGLSSANTFVGIDAGRNTTSAGNSFFGNEAGYNAQGGQNSFFGRLAGRNIVNSQANTMIGRGAGGTNLVGGSSNTFLGAFADAAAANTSLDNATAIGFRAAVSQNNSLVLGGINGINGATIDTNVGIGTTAPLTRLHIADNNARILFGGAGCSSGHIGFGFAATLTCGNYSMLGNGSSTLINRPTGGSIHFRENNGDQVVIQPGGTVQLFGLGTAGGVPLCFNPSNQISLCSSSIRYKKDINTFRSGIDLINRLHPVSFKWKADDKADMGLVAEEVAAVEPLLVTYNKTGEIEGVKYDRISIVLINAVKEQLAQIEELRNELIESRKQLAELRALLCTKSAVTEICKEKE